MKKLLIFICFCNLAYGGYCQSWRNIDSLKQALSNAQTDEERVTTIYYLSWGYSGVNTDSSLLLAKQGLELARKINSAQGEVRALHRMSIAYRLLSDIPNSMQASLEAMQLAEKHGFSQEMALCNFNIGALYLDLLKDYPQALDYFRKAKEWDTQVKDEEGEFSRWILDLNIGVSYEQMGKLDSAVSIYNELLSRNSHPIYENVILSKIGQVHLKLKNYEEAISFFHKAINGYANRRLSSEVSFSLASCFREMGQTDSCLFYARNSLAEAEKIGYQQYIMNAATLLSEVYERENNPEALRFYKTAKLANDEVYGQRKVQVLQRIITEEMQRQQGAEKEKITLENQIRQYALLGGLAAVLLVAFFLYRNNRQKQKANHLLNDEKAKLENTLKELRTTQSQLIQSEKLASLGELTAGIAHEIQNPLNFVNNFSELSVDLAKELNEELEKDSIDKSFVKELMGDLTSNQQKINHHGKRAAAIVTGMLQHARTSTGKKEPTDLNALADEYLRLSYHGLRAKDSSFNANMVTDFDPAVGKVEVIPQDIGRVFLNIINNAFYATQQRKLGIGELGIEELGGEYEPTVSISSKKTDSGVEFRIKDNGTGIPDDVKAKIFQPFFTTKPTGQGTGLGLSLAYDIVVKGHGGTLEVGSAEVAGTEFVIKLPLHEN
jgi:signal transduction histidine kinase